MCAIWRFTTTTTSQPQQKPRSLSAGWGPSLTGERKKHDPVDDQHGPEDRHVEHLEPGAKKGDQDGARRADPELEFRQAPDEGAELLVLLDWQGRAHVVVLERLVFGEGGVEFGLEEGEEEVEEVDC